jgi:hypothetical protein
VHPYKSFASHHFWRPSIVGRAPEFLTRNFKTFGKTKNPKKYEKFIPH